MCYNSIHWSSFLKYATTMKGCQFSRGNPFSNKKYLIKSDSSEFFMVNKGNSTVRLQKHGTNIPSKKKSGTNICQKVLQSKSHQNLVLLWHNLFYFLKKIDKNTII